MRAFWPIARWGVVVIVLVFALRLALIIMRGAPGAHNVPFDAWYGNWEDADGATGMFLVFVLALAWPRRRGEWRQAGLYSAFLISLFTEMFGVPLTLYLLAPLLGLPVGAFALDRLGLVPLAAGAYLVMLLSLVLIVAGMSMVAVGWATAYRGRGALVTGGIYGVLRHPRYLGSSSSCSAST